MADDVKRFPISELPDPEKRCPICESGPFRGKVGIRAHMSSVHNILYEIQSDAAALEKFDSFDKTVKYVNLKPWMKMAISEIMLYGASYEDIGDKFGRAPDTIKNIYSSPGGQKFRDSIEQYLDKPGHVVKLLMEDASAEIYADWRLAFEWAKQNRDYEAVHRMAKDIALKHILVDEDEQIQPQIVINLGTNDIEPIEVVTSYEVLDDEDSNV